MNETNNQNQEPQDPREQSNFKQTLAAAALTGMAVVGITVANEMGPSQHEDSGIVQVETDSAPKSETTDVKLVDSVRPVIEQNEAQVVSSVEAAETIPPAVNTSTEGLTEYVVPTEAPSEPVEQSSTPEHPPLLDENLELITDPDDMVEPEPETPETQEPEPVEEAPAPVETEEGEIELPVVEAPQPEETEPAPIPEVAEVPESVPTPPETQQ